MVVRVTFLGEDMTAMKEATQYTYKLMKSPVGTLRLVGSDKGLAGVWFERSRPERVRPRGDVENSRHPVLIEAERQLGEYFDGRRRKFDLKIDFVGTDFQKSVWKALLTIPFGQTRSYGEIARQVGRPSASRAVGAANGRNPVSIVAPCHRVVGSTGALTGFGGGLDVKEVLLRLEGARL
jgi:methylated-DNA-[protein]-cysteine S-methyltransferase